MKQVRPVAWVGAFQVQLSTSMSHYIVYVNMMFVGMMFWHTTARPNLEQYLPWVDFWMFASFMLLFIAFLMVFDHKFVYPSRQAHLSKQAYKHDNPVVKDINKLLKNDERLLKNQKKIMEKLKIEEDV